MIQNVGAFIEIQSSLWLRYRIAGFVSLCEQEACGSALCDSMPCKLYM